MFFNWKLCIPPRKIHKPVASMLVDATRMDRVMIAVTTPEGADPADIRLLIAEGSLGSAMFSDSASAATLSNFGIKLEKLLKKWGTKEFVTDADIEEFVQAAGLLEEEYTEACGDRLARTARGLTLTYGDREVNVKVVCFSACA